MIFYSVTEIASIVGGILHTTKDLSEYRVSGIATDSRALFSAENSLFVALKGSRNDGHSFVPELAEKGVKVFLVSEFEDFLFLKDVALIEVPDTLQALQCFARYHRMRFNIPVVGITGSNGKTVIKEWLYDLLSDQYSIVRSPKSYNSQIGVPLSVLLTNPDNSLAIFEAGISRPGEMNNLEKIIRPSIGILTNIGDAHQENFETLQQKIQEKLLLFRHSGQLIYCADQQEISIHAEEFCRSNHIKPVGWSFAGETGTIHFEAVPIENGTSLVVDFNDRTCSFEIPFSDHSSIENACHCMAVILTLGLDPELFRAGFFQLEPLSMRLELKRGMNECLLLNDYYNSDINSLEIALTVLTHHARSKNMKKRIILSDIRQSGLKQEELYCRVNSMMVNAGIDYITGIGPHITQAARCFTIPKEFYLSTGEFLATYKNRPLTNEAILIKGARDFRFEEISSYLQLKQHQTVLEINMNALVENLNCIKSLLLPGTKVMVMVKAFSYGSGDTEIARILQLQHVDYLAVAVTDEGKELRNAGIKIPIIVMNPESHSFQQMVDYQLEPNLFSLSLAEGFARTVDLNGINQYPVHVKIDTGMNRLGIKGEGEIERMIDFFHVHPYMKLKSLFSHLAASDDPAMDGFTLGQIIRFDEISSRIIQALDYPVIRHILNSAGIERFPQYQFEMVRLGIGLYGISSTGLPLKHISRLISSISQIKEVQPDETIGYNRSGKVEQLSRIAVIPVGYADGLDRRLGNLTGNVAIRGKKVPIVGNICMDMFMADVTGIDCSPGDETEIFGEHITVQEMATSIGTIPYEILTGISQRVKRVYIQE
jgi:Alr-MurF fusion protein